MLEQVLNKKCIFRGDRSGIFYGTLREKDGREVLIEKCRRLWYWEGANSISDIAIKGVEIPDNCKFTSYVDSIVITDIIEIIPCTNKAIKNIESVLEWIF